MSLLRMSLSGTALILAIAAIRWLAMDRLPKKALPAFWSAAILRLLLPVSFRSLPGFSSSAKAVAPVLDRMESGITELAAGVLPPPPASTEAAAISTAIPAGGGPEISVWFLLWLAGALLFAGYFLVTWLRCRREFRTSLPVKNQFTERWLSDHPLRRRLEIRSLTGITAPLTYGLTRPVILMPKDTDWSGGRSLEYILYHEYLHIRRFDGVRKLLAAATVSIHWFNPAVWMLFLLYNRDMELVCDEGVLRHFGETDRAAYARTLIAAAQGRHRYGLLYNSFAKNAVEERIKAIMKFRKTTVLALAAAVVLVAAGTAASFAAGPKAAKADFADILQGNTQFLYISEGTAQPKSISDVPALFDPYDDYMKIWEFAIQDLDGDGSAEVILSVQGISGDTGGSLILHQIGDQVYGYLARNWELMYLKADGRFNYYERYAPSESGVCAIEGFTKTGYTVDKITYSSFYPDLAAFTYHHDACVVEHQPATEEEFIAALNAHSQKPDAVWYDFTEENIQAASKSAGGTL